MSTGLPIIAARYGQIHEIIEHRVNGYMYNPNSPDDLLRVIESLIDNKNERIQVGNCAKKDLEIYHTWEKRMGQLLIKLKTM